MAMFKKTERSHLCEAELNGLWGLLTGQYLLKPRYASAFLSVFSQDLAEQMPQVVHAGIQVHTSREGPTQLADHETIHLLELTCTLVAVSKYRQMSAYRQVFPIDAQKAVWCIILAGGPVVKEFASDVLDKVTRGIDSALGENVDQYVYSLDEIENQRSWDQARAEATQKYDCGETDSDEFANDALGILLSCPYTCQYDN